MVRRLHDAGYKSFTEEMINHLREQKDAAMYDRAWDIELLRLLQPHRFVTAGYDAIMAFWFAKELEVTNLRILLAGKLNNFSVDRLYALQRPLYLTAHL
jgi:V/A-type H+/Na+-transporting ATPase subunit C